MIDRRCIKIHPSSPFFSFFLFFLIGAYGAIVVRERLLRAVVGASCCGLPDVPRLLPHPHPRALQEPASERAQWMQQGRSRRSAEDAGLVWKRCLPPQTSPWCQMSVVRSVRNLGPSRQAQKQCERTSQPASQERAGQRSKQRRHASRKRALKRACCDPAIATHMPKEPLAACGQASRTGAVTRTGSMRPAGTARPSAARQLPRESSAATNSTPSFLLLATASCNQTTGCSSVESATHLPRDAG